MRNLQDIEIGLESAKRGQRGLDDTLLAARPANRLNLSAYGADLTQPTEGGTLLEQRLACTCDGPPDTSVRSAARSSAVSTAFKRDAEEPSNCSGPLRVNVIVSDSLLHPTPPSLHVTFLPHSLFPFNPHPPSSPSSLKRVRDFQITGFGTRPSSYALRE